MGPLVISESGIGGQHGLIRPDRVRRAVGDLAPASHDDEAPRDAQDGLHVVIDDNERPPTAVELAKPLDVGERQEGEVAPRAPDDLLPGRVRPRQTGHEHVLEHGHAAEKLRQLKRPRDAHRGVDVRRAPAHPLPANPDLPAVRGEVAGQQVDERRLAGAIPADQPDEVTRGDDEIHGVVRHDAAEPLDETDASHELGAPAHLPGSLCGTAGAATSGSPRASPNRRNGSHNGVSSPLRAKRMVSSNTMPKTGSRHWPYSRSHSSRNCTTNAPPTAVGRRSMPPITVMTTSFAISSRSPTLGVMMPM